MRPQKQEPPQETATEPQEEELNFNGGGGGEGKPFFRSSSFSSSYICRPDPDNPGKQICTRTESSNSFDPHQGHQSQSKRSEETRDGPQDHGLWSFMRGDGQP